MVSIYELKLGAEKLEILKTLSAEIEKAIASIGKIDNSRLNTIYNDILEKANQVLQDKNFVQELKDKVDVAHKDISEKAATINQKFEQQQTLLESLRKLKAEIEVVLKSGIINDEAQSAIQTYSSNLIERKLATKASVEYGYSKIEANAKFETLAQGITTAISATAGKLGKTEQAADSAKLGGAAASINETADTIVKRTQEGDIKARYSLCEHVGLGANTQDNLMGATSELIFRNAEDKYERGATLTRVLQCLNSVQNDVAWMDSDAITPDNKNQVGYARLPGGLIIQFGMTHRLATGEARTQIFPMAFPHACFVVLCSPHLPLPENGILSPYTQAWSTTTCTVKNVDSDSSCHIAWIAIGN
ncbi:hypothetical protein [uncultured Campylobacter sp.]|uniref:gp53-like domain-containing protein n=1 Tax=uncultured Campylobacter sp. TaxID=218934 RepID=UPI00263073E3|nr:hypothetical protein [uncultured Campylobacter sp.]